MAALPCEPYINTDLSQKELRAHGTSAFPAACYHSEYGLRPVPAHWHSELEIILVTEGDMLLGIRDREYTIPSGMCVFINSGVLHSVRPADGPTDIHSLVFSAGLIGGQENSVYWDKYLYPLMQDHNLPCMVLNPAVEWQRHFIDNAARSWDAIAHEEEGYEFIARTALSKCIYLIDRHHHAASVSPLSPQREERLKTMMTFIHTHYAERLSLNDIAASAAISPAEAMRCFRQGMKRSPMHYVQEYRLTCAAGFLKTTEWPISEIAVRCGFQEMGYFARRFKDMFGMRPGEYRHQELKAIH